ncbi:hypothetical protein LCGC14_1262650 [marine sediment metagenome]|uniref:Uncharacterized protein n=1 Tax=marine sediment metagenome TaxID=412755 RepID=A0A0F9P3K3_9ZZZZ
MRPLRGVRFVYRCARGEIWHTWAIERWLRARHFVYRALRVKAEPLLRGRVNITATWEEDKS